MSYYYFGNSNSSRSNGYNRNSSSSWGNSNSWQGSTSWRSSNSTWGSNSWGSSWRSSNSGWGSSWGSNSWGSSWGSSNSGWGSSWGSSNSGWGSSWRNNSINGTSRGDRLRGTSRSDIIQGYSGNDTIYGRAGNDQIYGGSGNDVLRGDSGNDILKGGAGNDRLHGGSNTDTAVYQGRFSDYDIEVLGNGSVKIRDLSSAAGREGVDTLTSIEKLKFSDRTIWVSELDNGKAPTFENLPDDGMLSIMENMTEVIDVETDDDKSHEYCGLTYSIVGGADHEFFEIDRNTGVLSFKDAPDYENRLDGNHNNKYDVTIQVRDEDGNTTEKKLWVTVTNKLDISGTVANDLDGDGDFADADPGLAGVTLQLFEDANQDGVADGAAIATATTDANGNYSFGERFAAGNYLVQETDPDGFESTSDSDGGNPNQVAVSLSNRDANNINFLDTEFTPNEPPTFSNLPNNGMIPILENTTFVTDIESTDDQDQENGGLTYSIVGGIDQDFFSINEQTGELSFINAPDFETPLDSNQDNKYDVNVRVQDADGGFTDKALWVIVNDALEISGTVSNDQDGDGDFADADPGLGGVTLQLFEDANQDGVADGAAIATATTAADGTYSFGETFTAGNYIVQEADPAGFISTNDSDGGNPNQVAVSLSDSNISDVNFLDAEPAPPSEPPQLPDGTYAICSHPDGNAATPYYGLRLDGLIPDASSNIFTFNFNPEDFEGVDMRITIDGDTIRIHGTAFGGPDLGDEYDLSQSGLWEIDFTYSNVSTLAGDDDLIVDDQFAGTNTGTITQLYGDGRSFNLEDYAGNNGYSFQFGDTANDNGHRGFDGISAWGWLSYAPEGQDPGPRTTTSDWLFTVKPDPIDPNDNTAPVAANDAVNVDEDAALVITAAELLSNDSDSDGDSLSITNVSTPGNGALVDNNDGTYTYTPDADYNGSDSFTYTITDGNGGTDTATVNITVNPVNDAPVAANDTVTTDEDNSVTFTAAELLSNDTDIDSTTLSIINVTDTNNGTLIDNGDGTYTYTPNPDYNGPDAFTYTVSDGDGGTDTATVNITVNSVNDAPVAANDTVITDEDNSVTFTAADLLSNDTDIDSTNLSITDITDPGNGTLVDNGDGTYTYTPNPDYNGSDSVIYTVSDGDGGSDTATVNITVNAVNDAPVAANDTVTTDEDNSVTFTATELLSNDTDIDSTNLTITSVTDTNNGTLVDNGDGTYTYTPDPDYNGADAFTYTVSDGDGGTDTATVNITVNAVNDAPIAADDEVSTNEDNAVTITAADLLSNDVDIDSANLMITNVTPTSNGELVDNGDGTYTYTPDPNYFGSDEFTYTIDDGAGGTDTATVTLTVHPINDAPVAADDAVTTDEDTAITITAAELLSNDTDIDGPNLTITSLGTPGNGSLVNNGDGTYTYTPDQDFNGADAFTYIVSDGVGGADTATVNITVNPVNDAPVANDDALSVDEDNTLVITAADLLGNDTDIDSPTLTLVSITDPSNGTLVDNGDGTYDYTPNPDYFGPDTFTYTVTDGSGATDTATVNITVNPVNDAPVANNDALSVDEDNTLVITAADLLGNDTDIDSPTLTIASVTAPGNGTLADNGDGTYAYTPDLNYNGPDVFSYTVSDGAGGTDNAIVNITVNPVNDAPVANNDALSVDEDNTLVITAADLLGNDTDIDSPTLTIASVTPPGNGILVDNGDGTYDYTPNPDYFGPDVFSYTVSDGSGGEDTALVNITVNPVNDAPVANNDALTTLEDTALVITAADLLGNDVDVDGDTLAIANLTAPSNGVLVDNGDSTYTYTPNLDYSGPDVFSYTVSDGAGGTDTALVNITVDPVNDPPIAADDALSVDEDTALVINASDLLNNDIDPDSPSLSITNVTLPGQGSLTDNGNGTFTYLPDANYFGPDAFSYTVDDGQGGTDTAMVNITVNPVNDAPDAVNDSFSTDEDTFLIINAADLLSNDSDIEGDTLTIDQVNTPGNGVLVDNNDGTYTYTPNADYNGTDTFTYVLSDGNGGTDTATVEIEVNPINDAPIALDNNFATFQNLQLLGQNVINGIPGDVNNLADIDVDGDVLSIASVNGIPFAELPNGPISTTNGSVTVQSNGSFVYTPNFFYFGPDNFTYSVTDGQGQSELATVNISVIPGF